MRGPFGSPPRTATPSEFAAEDPGMRRKGDVVTVKNAFVMNLVFV